MLGNIRRYDVQATWAMVFAVLSLIPLAGAAVLAAWKYNGDMSAIVYNRKGPFLLLYLACIGSAGAAGVLSFCLGLNSAGQRRNDKSKLSWTAFFLGGASVTLALVLLAAFWMLRQGLTPGAPAAGFILSL